VGHGQHTNRTQYLRAAGVAAVWIDADGCIGADETASLKLPEGRIAYCCARGAQFVLAYRLQIWKQEEVWVAVQTITAKLEELAEAGGLGLTPHQVAVDRAMAAVATVNAAIEKMGADGELQDLNRAFKEARRADPSIRYGDYLEARKVRCSRRWCRVSHTAERPELSLRCLEFWRSQPLAHVRSCLVLPGFAKQHVPLVSRAEGFGLLPQLPGLIGETFFEGNLVFEAATKHDRSLPCQEKRDHQFKGLKVVVGAEADAQAKIF
jgi:hypothetical protein